MVWGPSNPLQNHEFVNKKNRREADPCAASGPAGEPGKGLKEKKSWKKNAARGAPRGGPRGGQKNSPWPPHWAPAARAVFHGGPGNRLFFWPARAWAEGRLLGRPGGGCWCHFQFHWPFNGPMLRALRGAPFIYARHFVFFVASRSTTLPLKPSTEFRIFCLYGSLFFTSLLFHTIS